MSVARHRIAQTTLGPLTLVGEGDTLTGVYYPGHWTRPDRAGFGAHTAGAFAEAERQLHEYLAGERTTFALQVSLPAAGPLRRAVWELLAAIPYGETRTYRWLADRLGSHPRAVGSAVAHNPLSIVVPCHRVLGSGGSLTGYAGGLQRKASLLALEGVPAPA